MCQHQPPCPPAGAPDHQAARVVAPHPEQGWSLLCNGVVAFDDTGVGTPCAARLFQRWVASLHAHDLMAAEPALRRLLIVCGAGDVFFHRKWAYWLRGTIPGAAVGGQTPLRRLLPQPVHHHRRWDPCSW
jgi:hypothetical protein